jgi:uncharacterized membrane protein YhaH (DUF805 family)
VAYVTAKRTLRCTKAHRLRAVGGQHVRMTRGAAGDPSPTPMSFTMNIRAEFLPAGRLGRTGFWLRHALTVPALLFACIATADLLGRPADLVPTAALVAHLVSIWSRRLHDRGRSAWWLLLTLLPLIGALILFVECGLRRSAPYADRFGTAPGARPDYLTVAP